MDAKEYNDMFYSVHGADVHDDPDRFTKIAALCKGSVLDVACGTGTLAKYYKGPYTGFDISGEALKMASQVRRKDANWEQRDVTKSQYDTKAPPDTIVLAEFLEHIENDEEVIKNLLAWGHEKTRWVISVPNAAAVQDKDHKRTFTVPQLRTRFSEYGRVRFHNWIGFSKRIIMTVERGEKPKKDIGLCMIVWNEAVGMERAILSCIDFVDEIVISVDKKSTDDTLTIAHRYADIVKSHTWRNDFSAARNSAQEGMESDWILALDGHEYVKKAPDIHSHLLTNADGLLVKIIMENGASFFYPRLFRKKCFFKHPVHNLIQCDNPKPYHEFIIQHDRAKGTSKEQREARKKQRDFMMPVFFRINLFWDKKDTRSRFYLARYYQEVKKYKKALKHYKIYLKYANSPIETWNVLYQMHICACVIGKPRLGLTYLDMADKIIPHRWETYKRRGIIYKVLGVHTQAILNLKAALKPSPHVLFDSPEGKEDGHTLIQIGEAHFGLKEYKEAQQAWKDALTYELDSEQKEKTEKRLAFVTDLIDNPKRWQTTPQQYTNPAQKKMPTA